MTRHVSEDEIEDALAQSEDVDLCACGRWAVLDEDGLCPGCAKAADEGERIE